jgi:hypothetical protein
MIVSIFLLTAVSPAVAQIDVATPAEASGFTAYTTYAEMMDYLQAVQAASLEMQLEIYGESYEGREIPVAIFSRPVIHAPWEALVSGKPIVVIAANVHGGERTFRRSIPTVWRRNPGPPGGTPGGST